MVGRHKSEVLSTGKKWNIPAEGGNEVTITRGREADAQGCHWWSGLYLPKAVCARQMLATLNRFASYRVKVIFLKEFAMALHSSLQHINFIFHGIHQSLTRYKKYKMENIRTGSVQAWSWESSCKPENKSHRRWLTRVLWLSRTAIRTGRGEPNVLTINMK